MNIVLIVITLLSLTVAAAMSIVAWRAVRNERRRSDARVRALAADIQDRDHLREPDDDLLLRGSGEHPMFARAQRSRLGVAAAVGVLAVGASAALVVALGGAGRSSAVEPRSGARRSSSRRSATNATPTASRCAACSAIRRAERSSVS